MTRTAPAGRRGARSAALRSRAVPVLALSIQGHERFDDLPAPSTLRGWVRLALRRSASLVLRFVGVWEARKLNREYRGQNHATNVLTFDYLETPVRADIVLCVPVIAAEARRQGRPFRNHLAHLVVHGVLHAQGYDHTAPPLAAKMESVERRILARLGIQDPYL